MNITIEPILWTHRPIKENERDLVVGEYAILIRMCQDRKRTYMATGFSSTIENWSEKEGYPEASHPKFKALTSRIRKLTEDISFEIKLAEKSGRVITPIEIKTTLTERFKSSAPADKPNKILAYYKYLVDYYQSIDSPGYANVFEANSLTVKKLLKGKDKMFLAFTKSDHEAYEKQIAGKAESTKSVYLRTYYRVWNLAIEDGICSKDHHPKKHIKFKAYKRIRTKKRSIKSSYWQRILKLKPARDTRIYRSHLLMQFMYYARGMNFNDMLKLKREQFINDGIVYKRSKNKRGYDFELHPRAVAIIKEFESFPEQSDAGYIFPFIMREHDTAKKIDARIDSALKDFNEDSNLMALAVGWNKGFTSNALRHGFASHLNEANVDIKIIQEALGHETQAQTRVYLDDIDDSIIADAIRAALVA